MGECGIHVTYICNYCGAELAVIFGIPEKKSLVNMMPDKCPYCGKRLRKEIDWFNVKVDFNMARAKECDKKKSKKE